MLPFRSDRATVVALLAVVAAGLLPVGTAQAASRTVQGGRLDWGIKSSFQSYVTGPIANGSWSLTGGAATVGGSQFRFHSATGTYDPATGAFASGFSGGVHFVGHRAADGANALDLTISRPTVRISGGRGTVYADMVSKNRESGRVTSTAQVPLATLGLSGIDMLGGSTPLALNSVPATLTSQGAAAFAGYYTAGTPLDPVSLSVDTTGPAAKPETPTTPKPSSPARTKATEQKAGRIEDGAVDWGVRRTFREYVTGDIGQGEWTLTDGAQDGGALFRFPKGTGTYDAKKQKLDAAFTGSIRFTGAQELDLELAGITVTTASDKGTLSADVTREGATRKDVPLITFAARDFAPKDGLAVLTETPTTLTAEGADAFGSLYKAGTAMDPVSLAVAVDDGARLPALPDLGSDPTPSAKPAATAEATETAEAATVAASSDSGVGPGTYLAIGGVLVFVAAAGALYAGRRRRARSAP